MARCRCLYLAFFVSEVLPFSVCPVDRFLESLNEKTKPTEEHVIFIHGSFHCLLFLPCPVTRNGSLQGQFKTPPMFS